MIRVRRAGGKVARRSIGGLIAAHIARRRLRICSGVHGQCIALLTALTVTAAATTAARAFTLTAVAASGIARHVFADISRHLCSVGVYRRCGGRVGAAGLHRPAFAISVTAATTTAAARWVCRTFAHRDGVDEGFARWRDIVRARDGALRAFATLAALSTLGALSTFCTLRAFRLLATVRTRATA